MKAAFAIVCCLIAYGSLYPFGFAWPGIDGLTLRAAGLLNLVATSRGDFIGNIGLFIPFGLTGALALLDSKWRPRAAMPLLLGGAGFAAALQLLQLLLPSRAPSITDLLLNLAGIIAGLILARHPRLSAFAEHDRSAPWISPELLIGALWPLALLIPMVPTIDAANLQAVFKPVLTARALSIIDTAYYLIAWLAAMHLLTRPPTPSRYLIPAVLLPLAVLAVQPLILQARLTPAEVVGSLVAVGIWLFAYRRLDSAMLAIALLLAVLATNLLPLPTIGGHSSFSFVPFSGFLDGNMLLNSVALFEKLFAYAAVLLLFRRAGIGMTAATVVTVAALALQEAAQAYLGTGTPEITDPLLALGIAVLLMYIFPSHQPVTARIQIGQQDAATPPSGTGRTDSSAATPREQITSHLPGLDGLRAVAALGVFLVHYQQIVNLELHVGPFDLDRWLTNGNTGVALFFVLSGYLLSLPLLNAGSGGLRAQDLRNYLVRRLARIVPAYYLCLFGLIALALARGNPPSINNTLSHMLFLYNFNDGQIFSINPPFWTLAVEVQFYCLLPFIILGLVQLPRPLTIIVAIALVPIAQFLNQAVLTALRSHAQWPMQSLLVWPFALRIQGPDSPVLVYSTLGHLTFFLFGTAAAATMPLIGKGLAGLGHLAKAVPEFLVWLSALIIFIILATPLDDWAQQTDGRYNWPLVPLLLTSIVILTPYTRGAARLLEWVPLRMLGLISYGIYLFHLPVQKASRSGLSRLGLDTQDHPLLFAGVAFTGTLLLSFLSYRLLEQPIRRWVHARFHGPAVAETPRRRSAAGARWTYPSQDKASRPPEHAGADTVFQERVSALLRLFGLRREPRRPSRQRSWLQVRIRLSERNWASLQGLAEQQDASPSRVVRRMLDQWLEGRGADEHQQTPRTDCASPAPTVPACWCVVNLRRSRAAAIEAQLEHLGVDLEYLVAQIIEEQLSRAETSSRRG